MRNRSTSSRELALYFKDVTKYPLLTAAEEKELARLVKGGDKVAMERLITSNLRFVLKVARSYRRSGVPLADLINQGNLGLIEAARRFDADRNIRFTSYAIWWIRQSIVKMLYRSSILRRSQRSANVLYRLGKFRQSGSAESDPQILSKELGFTVRELKLARMAETKIVSLDAPMDGNDNLTLGDLLQQEPIVTAEEVAAQRQMKEHLERSLRNLSSREEVVLRKRYGLNEEKPKTLREIGSFLNLSRERVRQIEMRALKKLRTSPMVETLASHLIA